MSAFILVLIWTTILFIFAAIYVQIDSREVEVECGLGKKGSPIDYYGAFAFALETTTTVSFLLCYQFDTILRPNIIHYIHTTKTSGWLRITQRGKWFLRELSRATGCHLFSNAIKHVFQCLLGIICICKIGTM